MGVRGFAPSMVGGPCRPRSSSKIIAPNREPLVFRTNLEKVGIALLRSNGRKGLCPFNGWRPVPPSLFIQNHCAKSGNLGFGRRTPEVCTNLSWEVRFLRERGGDRSIGGANLRKGLAPSMEADCRPRAWLAHLAPSSSKIIAPNRGALVFLNGLRKRVRTSHMGGSFFFRMGRG